jgi:hypothetical protein
MLRLAIKLSWPDLIGPPSRRMSMRQRCFAVTKVARRGVFYTPFFLIRVRSTRGRAMTVLGRTKTDSVSVSRVESRLIKKARRFLSALFKRLSRQIYEWAGATASSGAFSGSSSVCGAFLGCSTSTVLLKPYAAAPERTIGIAPRTNIQTTGTSR